MEYKEFMGEVQHRLELPDTGRAVRATRATLSTVGEQLTSDTASALADTIPVDADYYLRMVESGQNLSFDEFMDRLSERARADPPDALYDAAQIIALVNEFAPEGTIQRVRDEFTGDEDFEKLFQVIDQGDATRAG